MYYIYMSYNYITYWLLLGHHQYINCFQSLPTSIMKSRIKIDYLIKSHMNKQFLVESYFNHCSGSEM